jgi:hypothetical protein
MIKEELEPHNPAWANGFRYMQTTVQNAFPSS